MFLKPSVNTLPAAAKPSVNAVFKALNNSPKLFTTFITCCLIIVKAATKASLKIATAIRSPSLSLYSLITPFIALVRGCFISS